MTKETPWLVEHADIQRTLECVSTKIFGLKLSTQLRRALALGRCTRSLLFANTARHLSDNVEIAPDFDNIVFAIEASHAASILVDDLIDGDAIRHHLPTTSRLWGVGRSSLSSHLLSSGALCSLGGNPPVQRELLNVYFRMARAEARDVFLDDGSWVADGYSAAVFDKTSALFGFALATAATLSGHNREADFKRLGELLGEMYQLCNDYHDWQPDRLLERHGRSDAWPVTFALPLAVYIQMFGIGYLPPLRERPLSTGEWMTLLDVVWCKNVKDACDQQIAATEVAVHRQIAALGLSRPLASIYEEICCLAQQGSFWFSEYVAP